jgi:hypothetical protein
LEELLGRKLLYLACRHHVHELVAGTAFEGFFGKTTAPQPAIFVRFKNAWFSIDKKAYRKLSDKRLLTRKGKKMVADTLEFLYKILNSDDSFLRDDYKEFAELCVLILGGSLKKDYVFKACGAVHHARWMAKIIYVFKIYLFR